MMWAVSCDKAPRGVIGESKMTDLVIDLELAEAYIDNHPMDFADDSSKLVLKQSIFKKHGITAADYDTSLVWYAHNMESYTKVYEQVIRRLESRRDKLQAQTGDMSKGPQGIAGSSDMAPPQRHPVSKNSPIGKRITNATGDTIDMWQGSRSYVLNQGMKSGFISFDFPPDAQYKAGDRYQLVYKLSRCANEFKVSVNIDYSDGYTAQVTRPTNSDGWITVDIQSDTARRVKRIYGYVSYNLNSGHIACVDSLTLLRTHMNSKNYAFIKSQRLFER